jgi:hypothetical protein
MRRHFRNVSIIDASGAAPFRGTVTVEGEKIAAVTRAPVLPWVLGGRDSKLG